MKKVKIVLPLVAVMFAVVGVFATGNSVPASTAVDVSASSALNCIKDGTCTQAGSPNCQLPSATFTFKVKEGVGETCGTNATGAFAL